MYQDLEIMLQSYFSPNAPYPSIDKVDPRGCTALHIAVMKGHLECVKVLIKAGASCVIKNSEGWTLTNEATSLGNRDILELVVS
jgi:ankyrin repeat protein